MLVNYAYDSWGKVTEITGNTALAEQNPIRYRSYYYDFETEWHFLSSRYYNAEACRFVNSDNYALPTSTPTDITDKNLYSYCDNNPIVRADVDGDFWHIVIGAAVGGAVSAAFSAITQYKDNGNVNFVVVGVNFLSGAISGGVAMTGIGLAGSIAVNAALGGGNYIAEQVIKGEKLILVMLQLVLSWVALVVLLEVRVQMVKASLKHIRAQLRELKEKIEEKTLSMRQSRWQDVNLGKKTIKSAVKVAFSKIAFCNFFSAFTSRKLIGIRKR